MNRSKIAIRNSTVGLISQMVAVIFQFVTRSVFVKYLGVELLGISSTFSSVLNTLSLAELGFQSAIVYSLYEPLEKKNFNRINSIINVLKVIYRVIGIFFIVAGIAFSPFLKYILSGVEITRTVYLIFYIQVANSACSYFLAYKRSLLYADKREFMTKIVDTAMNVLMNVLKIIVVIKTSDYIIYISLTTMQTILSNLIIHALSRKVYPYLHKTKFDVSEFKKIWENVKNLFVGKIAYYIYTSTDSLVVSTFVSTVSVGFMVNYVTVINSIKSLTNSLLNPVTPIIGGMLATEDNTVKKVSIFNLYTFIRYIFASAIVIPTIVLMQSFISIWVGDEYLLSGVIVVLYGTDLFIHIVHSALCDFINGSGLFGQDKNIEIVGALCNIVGSIVLAQFMGIAGVLAATVFSQVIFWIGRSLIAYRYCFAECKSGLRNYWLRSGLYIGLFYLLTGFCTLLYRQINIENSILRFILGGICCEAVIGVTLLIIFFRSFEFKQLINLVKKLTSKRKGRAA